MNFQAVSVGQKLVQGSDNQVGGYVDALGTPTPALLSEIRFVDEAIGDFVEALQQQGLYNSTLIIISAKHGQSPIDPNRLLRIPGDNAALQPPSALLGSNVAQALEDDISVIWLKDQSQTLSSAELLSENLNTTGGGEVFAGRSLELLFNSPSKDPRTPDIIVNPNVGVVYTGHKAKVAEHGGFANDDRNVIMLVSNPQFAKRQFFDEVETRQVAPTVLRALGLDPDKLDAVRLEGTTPLSGLPF
jgi:arylsulfatase A-like enzyme